MSEQTDNAPDIWALVDVEGEADAPCTIEAAADLALADFEKHYSAREGWRKVRYIPASRIATLEEANARLTRERDEAVEHALKLDSAECEALRSDRDDYRRERNAAQEELESVKRERGALRADSDHWERQYWAADEDLQAMRKANDRLTRELAERTNALNAMIAADIDRGGIVEAKLIAAESALAAAQVGAERVEIELRVARSRLVGCGSVLTAIDAAIAAGSLVPKWP